MQCVVLYVLLLAGAAVSGQALPDVVMFLSYEGKRDYTIGFKFTSDVFKSFYTCLCGDDTSRCLISYDHSNVIQNVSPEIIETAFMSPCKLYTCAHYRQTTRIICNSLPQGDSCARKVTPTFVSLVDLANSCSASCVGIAWNLDNENLTFKDQQLQVRQCGGSQCCSGVASAQPPLQNVSSSEHLWVYETVNQEDYTDTYIVAGIGGGVLLIAIVVFVVLLLLKSRTGSSVRQREVNHVTQSSTNGTNHNFYPNNAVINATPAHTSDAGKDTNKKIWTINPFAGFGLSKAKHTNQNKNKDTDDTWNKPGHTDIKSDGHNQDISDDSSDFDGDYTEIDDIQIQDPDSLGYTPDSLQTDPNDGYSTVDNSDYYNITDVAPGSADNNSNESPELSKNVFTSKEASVNKEKGTGMQTTTHKTLNIPVQARNVSEYSIAAAISDGASTYSIGQQVDGSSSDQGFTSEQERDNASDDDSGGRKRNSYFILEKETEEQDI